MQTDYTPPPANIAEALRCLGSDWDGHVTEASYPALIGQLLARAEATAGNLLKEEDEPASEEAYAGTFLTYARQPASSPTEKAESWDEFLVALANMAQRLSQLHTTAPTVELPDIDAVLANAVTRAAEIAASLTRLRIGVSLDVRNQSMIKQPVETGLPKLVVGIRELDNYLSELGDITDDVPYLRHVVKDLGDDYDEVMGTLLDQMVSGGYLTGWEHQPENGSGNGSIVLLHPKYGGGYVMNYDDALDYACGFVDAIKQVAETAALKGIEDATKKAES